MFEKICRNMIVPLGLMLSIGIIACTPKDKNESQSNLEDGLVLPMPTRLKSVGAVVISTLTVEVELTNSNNGVIKRQLQQLDTSNGDIRGEVGGLVPDTYKVRLKYFIVANGIKVEVVITDPVEVIVLNAGSSPAVFEDSMNHYPDGDNDGHSNLHEVDNATDWTNILEFPPLPDDPVVSAAVQDLNVILSWDPVGGADVYKIYLSETPITAGIIAGTTPYSVAANNDPTQRQTFSFPVYLNNDTGYFIAVKSVNNDAGDGDTSVPIKVNPKAFIPQEFQIVLNDHRAIFSWNFGKLPAPANSMNLYMQNSPSVQKWGSQGLRGWMSHLNIPQGFEHGALGYKNPYYFALTARRGDVRVAGDGKRPNAGIENSAVSTEVVMIPQDIVPGAPQDFGIHFIDGKIELVRTLIDSKIYAIYHSTSIDSSVLPFKDKFSTSDAVKQLKKDAVLPYTLSDTDGIDFRVPNYFTITLLDGITAVESGESAIVGFIPHSYIAPPEITGIEVVDNQTLKINWSKVSGADSYTMYMDQVPIDDINNLSPAGMMHDAVVDNFFTHAGLQDTKTYYFMITAVNGFGESAPSAGMSASPVVPPDFALADINGLPFPEVYQQLVNNAKFDIKLIPSQTNDDPSVNLIGIFKPGSTTAETGLLPEGSSVEVKVTMPLDGGEFLTAGNGAGSDAGANAYYAAIDPDNQRDTFLKWKDVNKFSFVDNNDPANITYEVPDAQVLFFNGKDHDLARVVSLKRSGANIAFYADHFASLEDATTIDPVARKGKLKETVAIEFSPPADVPAGTTNAARSKAKYLKFFAFNSNGDRVNKINLDGRGEKFLPEACVVCHAGDATTYAANETKLYPFQGNLGSRFSPLDLDALSFLESDAVYNRAVQEAEFRLMNRAIRDAFGASREVTLKYQSATTGEAASATIDCPAQTCTAVDAGAKAMALAVAFQEGVVDDVNVSVDFLSHASLADLELRLVSPAGTEVLLAPHGSMSGVNLGAADAASFAAFDDQATRGVISTGSAPYNGTWKPVTSVTDPLGLAKLNGEDATGRWQLKVLDFAAGNTGFVEAWSLTLSLKAPAVELIEGWYGGSLLPSGTQDGSFVPRGWRTIESVQKFYTDNPTAPATMDGPTELYSKVIKESCRVCHLQRGSTGSILDFATWDNFNKDSADLEKHQRWLNRIEHEVYVEGNMPRALPTFRNFWLSEQPQILAKFLRPGSATQVPASPAPFDGLKGPGKPFLHSGRLHNVTLGTTLGSTGTSDDPNRLGARTEHFTQDASGNFSGQYFWELVSFPQGSAGAAVLTNTNAQYPTLTPDLPGEYILRGTVAINGYTSNYSEERVYVSDSTTVKNPYSFVDISKDVFKSTCLSCHRAGGPADHTGFLVDREVYTKDSDGDLNTAGIPGIYDLVVNKDFRINPATTTASRLLIKPSSDRPSRTAPFSNAVTHAGGIMPGFDLNPTDATTNQGNYDTIKNWIDLRTLPGGKPPQN